jgi:hypothetical protein
MVVALGADRLPAASAHVTSIVYTRPVAPPVRLATTLRLSSPVIVHWFGPGSLLETVVIWHVGVCVTRSVTSTSSVIGTLR